MHTLTMLQLRGGDDKDGGGKEISSEKLVEHWKPGNEKPRDYGFLSYFYFFGDLYITQVDGSAGLINLRAV